MKSAQINTYGSSEVIKINESTPEPTLTPGKVLVTIKAAGVNPADWKILSIYVQPFNIFWIIWKIFL
jgi:NADPH:quinone reductase-like Zn-dependent oxidoreductase